MNQMLLPAELDPNHFKREVMREACKRSLMTFVRMFWRAVEPRADLVEGWWLECLAHHLEAVSDGKIRRLLVNCPPGSMKSLMTNVFWPAWEWTGHPSMRYVAVAYSSALTERDNQRMSQVVLSPLYQELWGDKVTASENKIKFQNGATGWKLATSVSGIGTGERGDRIIGDDINNVQNVESDDIRSSALRWLREVMPTRLNSPTESAIVMIQQRSHEEDASGYLLSSEATDWVHLCIPMRYEPQRHCKTVIGWSDPRTQDGELFWPQRFPLVEVDKLETELGPYAASGQLQQLPSPRGGGIIKVEHWQMWPPQDDGSGEGWQTQIDDRGVPVIADDGIPKRIMVYPDWLYLLVALDTAYTEKEENDWSACTVWGLWADRSGNAKIMLVEAWRDRLELHGLAQKVMETCRRRKADLLLVEDKAAGHSVAQEVRRLMRAGEWTVRLWDPKRADKVNRLTATEPLFAGNLVYAPARRWARQVIDEVAAVPKGKYDDLADTVSMALLYLRKVGLAKLATEGDPVMEEDDLAFARRLQQDRSIAESYGL
jgi:predicted phage terminase large subunit-like protein